jgi:hypothetical protein
MDVDRAWIKSLDSLIIATWNGSRQEMMQGTLGENVPIVAFFPKKVLLPVVEGDRAIDTLPSGR